MQSKYAISNPNANEEGAYYYLVFTIGKYVILKHWGKLSFKVTKKDKIIGC